MKKISYVNFYQSEDFYNSIMKIFQAMKKNNKFKIEILNKDLFYNEKENLFDFRQIDANILHISRANNEKILFPIKSNILVVENIQNYSVYDPSDAVKIAIHESFMSQEIWKILGYKNIKNEILYPFLTDDKKITKEISQTKKNFTCGMIQNSTEDSHFSEWVLKAYKEFEDNIKISNFLLVGGSEKYTKQAKELNIKNFTQIQNYDKDIFFNLIDVFFHGNFFGNKDVELILQSLSAGIPVITHYGTQLNTKQEILNECGFVHGHFDSYLNELYNLYKNEDYRTWISNESIKVLNENFSENIFISKLTKIYEDMIENNMQEKKQENYLNDWIENE